MGLVGACRLPEPASSEEASELGLKYLRRGSYGLASGVIRGKTSQALRVWTPGLLGEIAQLMLVPQEGQMRVFLEVLEETEN